MCIVIRYIILLFIIKKDHCYRLCSKCNTVGETFVEQELLTHPEFIPVFAGLG
jgi:hypothetical protein